MDRAINVLLVEDDVLDQIQVQRAFDQKGIIYRLEVLKNGEDAMDVLKSGKYSKLDGPPDIILLDIDMPKMNGWEFLVEIKKHEELSSAKVFILTTSEEERKKSIALGAAGYIIKPIKLNSPSMDSIVLMIDIMNLQNSKTRPRNSNDENPQTRD
jgi:CheY-like chemotaxis protein